MEYKDKKAELEARFKPASAAHKLEAWLLDNPDMAPKAAKKAAKKVEPVEEAEE
jgi:hypothetical protein|tara:strand:+ start:278 stop:439 length:162 start_codon:yes stop_codon:yes gene_type:complete